MTEVYLKPQSPILGGSWVVIGRVISLLIGVISLAALLITPLLTALDPKPYRTLKGTLNPNNSSKPESPP